MAARMTRLARSKPPLDQMLRRATHASKRATMPSTAKQEKTRRVARGNGAGDGTGVWTIHATKAPPWTTRTTNRKANKAARLARRKNRA